MKDILVAEDLKGLYAALPTTWDPAGHFRPEPMMRNVERQAAIPMDGVYTTDSDGEFYALEHDEFERMVAAFAKAVHQTDMHAQVGVTWINTAGIIRRIKIALDHGIRCVHVGMPFWMPLSPSDVERFWEDLARSVPESRWVHYMTPRQHVMPKPEDYDRWSRMYPQFVGIKLGTSGVMDTLQYIEGVPRLALFSSEYIACPTLLMGARGIYSYWANTLPHWTRRFVDTCLAGNWTEAWPMQRRLLLWEFRHTQPVRDQGHLHGIVGKARAGLSRFLDDNGLTQPPYYPVAPETQDAFKRAYNDYWAGES